MLPWAAFAIQTECCGVGPLCHYALQKHNLGMVRITQNECYCRPRQPIDAQLMAPSCCNSLSVALKFTD